MYFRPLGPSNQEEDAMCPPDDGVVCYVLRTGFNSSQGELMRMIEFSTQARLPPLPPPPPFASPAPLPPL